ncbi:MAG: alpha/beta fold hydrolase [Deltaproteobacteria bacterium]|nr:alpha/beta fold hydrolase [Deltaproteobacteria bacterium]
MTDAAKGERRWRNLLGMVKRPKPVVGATPADVVHRENKWSLLRYRARPEGVAFATPVLLVPSLINRHYVLDLQPGRSIAEALVARGHDVFIVDWGTPGPEDRHLSFDAITDGYLGRAIRVAAQHGGRGKTHVLGYCLGGTLAVVHAAVRPEHIASLTVLAAPVSFHDEGLLSLWTRSSTFDLGAMIDATGNVPWQLMQGAFQMLRPTLPLSKAAHVIDRAWDDEFLDGFFALEAWGNDNVSFPGEAYRRYIEGLYRADGLMKETFTLSGRPVLLRNIECPTLAVTFAHDNIVPEESAAPLIERISSTDKQRVHLPGGHVGAVISRKALATLWPTISAWWAAHDAEPQAKVEPKVEPEAKVEPKVEPKAKAKAKAKPERANAKAR